MDLLKIDKRDWSVFKSLEDKKYTFIFSNNTCLRLVIRDEYLLFFHLEGYGKDKEPKYLRFYMNRVTGEYSSELGGRDTTNIDKFLYALMCFFFLTENTEIVVNPRKSYGTRKQVDALSNDSDFPVTIVNSNWTITSIRNEEFPVSGHFRLQRCGPGWSETELVFIHPFKKAGYIRKATKK